MKQHDDDDSGALTAASSAGDILDKQYLKHVKQAYMEHEEGYDDSPKFNSKDHRKMIDKMYSTIDKHNNVELFRIPYIDKEIGLNDMIGRYGLDTTTTN